MAASATTTCIEVFSVEDCCSKQISKLSGSATLAALVEEVRHEFAVDSGERLIFACGNRYLGEEDASRTLRDLGVESGAVVSFKLVDDDDNEEFGVETVDMAGRTCPIRGLLPSMSLAYLVCRVEEAACQPDEAATLILGTRPLGAADLGRSLGALGIHEGAQITVLRRMQDKSSCPRCSSAHRVLQDVTTSSTHEGWGRRWNRCQYDCARCGTAVATSEKVNVCSGCKCFWHRSCKLAMAVDASRT